MAIKHRRSPNSGKLCFLTFGKRYKDLNDMERQELFRIRRASAYYGRYDENKLRQRNNKQQQKRILLRALRWPEVCQRCGYSKCIAALDFHHKDPTQKTGQVLSMPYGQQVNEAAKCELICSNCHREVHFEAPPVGRRTGRPRQPLSKRAEAYLRHAGVTRPAVPAVAPAPKPLLPWERRESGPPRTSVPFEIVPDPAAKPSE